MDFKEITILRFFELILKDHNQTQRSISKRLNISLGNVNSMVRGLAKSGFVEIQDNSKNRVNYVITTKGGDERIRLAYKYLNYSLTFCSGIKDSIKRIFDDMLNKNMSSIAFYGAGEIAELAFVIIQQTPLKLVAIIDENLAGHIFFDMKIISPDNLSEMTYDKLLITELTNGTSVEQIISSRNISREKLVFISA